MRANRLYRIIVTVASLLAIPATQALCFDGFCIDTLRNNCWPEPFLGPDRHAARLPFHLMVHNGWRRQNMLDEHHFLPGTSDLTSAAKLKVRWILKEAPAHHRTIYVHMADDPRVTASRIEAVRTVAVKLSDGRMPRILETNVSSPGWPASQVDAIGRKFESSTPEPILRTSQGGGESN